MSEKGGEENLVYEEYVKALLFFWQKPIDHRMTAYNGQTVTVFH